MMILRFSALPFSIQNRDRGINRSFKNKDIIININQSQRINDINNLK